MTIALSACSLMPIPPEYSNQTIVTEKATALSDTSVDLDTAKKLLNGWHNVYTDAAQARRKWQLGFGETMFYGSVFAVLGAITNHDRLRNLGIAAAGGSSLASGHYQAGTQATAFRKAIKKLACMEEATMQITPADENQFSGAITADQRQVLVGLPVRIVSRIRKVRTELGDTLNGIELSTPSKDDIADAFQKWLTAKKKTTDAQAARFSDPDADAAQRALLLRKDRFAAALDKVEAEIDICMTEGAT